MRGMRVRRRRDGAGRTRSGITPWVYRARLRSSHGSGLLLHAIGTDFPLVVPKDPAHVLAQHGIFPAQSEDYRICAIPLFGTVGCGGIGLVDVVVNKVGKSL